MHSDTSIYGGSGVHTCVALGCGHGSMSFMVRSGNAVQRKCYSEGRISIQ